MLTHVTAQPRQHNSLLSQFHQFYSAFTHFRCDSISRWGYEFEVVSKYDIGIFCLLPLLDAIVSIRLLGFVSRINERMKKVRALFRLNYTIYISTFDNKKLRKNVFRNVF